MDRSTWPTLLGGALIALFLGPLVGTYFPGAEEGGTGLRCACADEDDAEQDRDGDTPADPAPQSEGIQWASGWEEARTLARTQGKLLFAYFGRHNPG